MSNRAARRQRDKALGVRKAAASRVRPIGQHGVEVDTADGKVHVALYAGEVAVSVAWHPTDARAIAQMVLDAVENMGGVAEDLAVTRESGLVIAPASAIGKEG